MPQTARSIHIFTRKGGYEPSFSLHHNGSVSQVAGVVTSLVPLLQPMIPESVVISRWEWQDPKGTVIGGGAINANGTLFAGFSSFTECSHLVWESAGTQGPSSMFLHPRPNTAYVEGVPASFWDNLVTDFAQQVILTACTDSEGNVITGLRSHKPSRRRRVRLAP